MPSLDKRVLKILYVGQLNEGGTCLQRMKVMQELGHEVVPLDVYPLVETGSRLVYSLRLRLSAGPGVGTLNRSFVRAASAARADVVWVDKGLYLRPETLRSARATGALLVHYNPDDPFGHFRIGWRNLVRAIPEYDVHLVPRDQNLSEYARAGARRVLRFHWAFDPATHRPLPVGDDDRTRLGGPVGFIGDWEREREASIRALAAAGVPVRIWGTNWNRCRSPEAGMRLEHRPLWSREYALGICAFDVNLGFLRKGNRDQSTTRSVEIPACGGFLLAERTDEHRGLFEEGREAEFFDGDEELVSKARYYLDHPEERRRIAEAGRIRCQRSGYSNQARLADLLTSVRGVARETAPAGREERS